MSDVKKLHRVDVRSLPNTELGDLAVAVVSRLIVTGGKHHRLHEELTVSGGYMKDASFNRETRVTQVNAWLDKASSIQSGKRLFEGLKRRFEKNQDSILQTVEARSRDRLRNLETTLETRKQQDIANITSVLDELEKAIEGELRKEREPAQLSLFSEDERTQVRRDTEALKLRLIGLADARVEGGRLFGRLKLADKHFASVIHCVDDEIIRWLERRERRKRDRLAGSRQSVYRYLP